jgi:hypothetical protein
LSILDAFQGERLVGRHDGHSLIWLWVLFGIVGLCCCVLLVCTVVRIYSAPRPPVLITGKYK